MNGPEAHPEDARIERLERNTAGQLVLRVAGCSEPFVDVRVARCFPWSLPEGYISIRGGSGRELVLIKDPAALDADARRLVAEELHDKIFNPRIRRVVDHKNEFGVISVTADTDRGRVTFQVRSRDDIRLLSPTRALLRDADGNTYEIEDLAALDAGSHRHLAQYF